MEGWRSRVSARAWRVEVGGEEGADAGDVFFEGVVGGAGGEEREGGGWE